MQAKTVQDKTEQDTSEYNAFEKDKCSFLSSSFWRLWGVLGSGATAWGAFVFSVTRAGMFLEEFWGCLGRFRGASERFLQAILILFAESF